MAWPEAWMASAKAYPCCTLTPGIVRASDIATWSNVLWSSLRTITRQLSPSPEPGPPVRGSSIVSVIGPSGYPAGLREIPLQAAVELGGRVVDLAEVGEAEALRVPARDRLERGLPHLHVDVRRRRRGEREG